MAFGLARIIDDIRVISGFSVLAKCLLFSNSEAYPLKLLLIPCKVRERKPSSAASWPLIRRPSGE